MFIMIMKKSIMVTVGSLGTIGKNKAIDIILKGSHIISTNKNTKWEDQIEVDKKTEKIENSDTKKMIGTTSMILNMTVVIEAGKQNILTEDSQEMHPANLKVEITKGIFLTTISGLYYTIDYSKIFSHDTIIPHLMIKLET